jgi:outer membrane protein assembly factor BamE
MLLLITGCGSWSNPIDRISPHRIEIQQGNALTQDMLDKLKPGMTPFHKNRWDYVYRLERSGKVAEQRRVTVIFEDDRLKALEGDVAAAGAKQATGQAQGKPEEGNK